MLVDNIIGTGLRLASLYRPAGEENLVGGDFFDAFETPDGWMLLVGDVTGRGAEAAALTGQARHTLRTAGVLLGDPAAALVQLNLALAQREELTPCTVALLHLRDRDLDVYCAGHPQQSGVYHYHGLSSCLSAREGHKRSKLLGWALDGFPIYGPLGKRGRYLRNSDLDACHGVKSKVRFRGRLRRIYHYVANDEFPYVVGCFRGTPTTLDLPQGGGPPGPPPGG